MNHPPAPISKTHSRKQGRTKIAKSKLASEKNVVVADSEAEIYAEFVVGALLYSLFSSSRSETVITFLPEKEQG